MKQWSVILQYSVESLNLIHGSYRLKELLFKEFSRTFPGLHHKIQGVNLITAFA